MQDKRLYLKIACLIEIIYIISMSIYYLFFNKIDDSVIANIFFLIISLYINWILYKESKKPIDELESNKRRVILASIWFFLNPVLPGIFGFIFLNSISDKKNIMLPKVNHESKKKSMYIKSFVLLAAFVCIMFIFPRFRFFSKVPSYAIYIFIFILIIILNYKELAYDFKIYIKNIKVYIPFIIKRYLLMLLITFLVAIPIVLINNGQTSANQVLINSMFKKLPFWTFMLSVLYAPFAEENVFRLSLSKFFNNKTLFIIISGILFGSLHMIDKITSASDLLYIIQYSTLGICLAKAYADSDNIFVSITIHFLQNFIAAIQVLIFY